MGAGFLIEVKMVIFGIAAGPADKEAQLLGLGSGKFNSNVLAWHNSLFSGVFPNLSISKVEGESP